MMALTVAGFVYRGKATKQESLDNTKSMHYICLLHVQFWKQQFPVAVTKRSTMHLDIEHC